LVESYYSHGDLLEKAWPGGSGPEFWGWGRVRKRAKHSDAVMTGILVTKFKMGQIGVEDLEQMAADESRAERCSAAKKVLDVLRDGT
jgi:hypothetical protein